MAAVQVTPLPEDAICPIWRTQNVKRPIQNIPTNDWGLSCARSSLRPLNRIMKQNTPLNQSNSCQILTSTGNLLDERHAQMAITQSGTHNATAANTRKGGIWLESSRLRLRKASPL